MVEREDTLVSFDSEDIVDREEVDTVLDREAPSTVPFTLSLLEVGGEEREGGGETIGGGETTPRPVPHDVTFTA